MDAARFASTLAPTLTLAVASVLFGCGADAPAPPPPATAQAERAAPAPIIAPRAVSGSLAFDLVATAGGAALAWGAPASMGGGVRAIALDPEGGPRGTEVSIRTRPSGPSEGAGPTVADELVLGSSGTRLGVAWIASGVEPEVWSAYSSQETEGLGVARSLGPTTPLGRGADASRGRLAMTTRDDGSIVLLRRLADGACSSAASSERDARCARIGRDPLVVAGDDALGAVEAELPEPCAAVLRGALASAGTSYHALCHGGASPGTTLYAIRPALSYAAAFDILPGCAVEALTPLEDGVAVSGRCESGLAVSLVDAMGHESARLSDASFEVACEAGRPSVTARGREGSRRIALLGALSRVEGILPERIAPARSRAAWTGSALLVAAPLGREVGLRRYACRDDVFTRTDLP